MSIRVTAIPLPGAPATRYRIERVSGATVRLLASVHLEPDELRQVAAGFVMHVGGGPADLDWRVS